jgi:glycosyltransferase involved in cell wall biosynthesis
VESLTVVILTRDEERNIGKCIQSIIPLTRSIVVIDSGSNDRTVEIAKGYGAVVAFREWTNHADQFNWGLDNLSIDSDWVMRLDADEEVTPGLVAAVRTFLERPPAEVTGIMLRRRVYFLGRWIRHGGYYPTWLLRVFRRGMGRCEARWMDEHIVVTHGTTISIHEDIIDKNNKDLTFWTDKHNHYASRELMDIIDQREHPPAGEPEDAALTGQIRLRRWLKSNVYARTPLFVRPFLYFVYRYFFRLGFLDGKEGLIFHFLQGFWYRFLVDAKLYEYELQRRNGKT